MKMITALTLMVSLIFLDRSPVLADDSDIFGVNILPNVMLLIDNSGSMNTEISSASYDPATTYVGAFTSTVVYKCEDKDNENCKPYTSTIAGVGDAGGQAALSTTGFWSGKIGGSKVTLFLGNYLNYQACTTCSGSEPKIDIAKRVAANIVNNMQDVRFGVMKFRANGGEMVAPVGTDKATMVAAINMMDAPGGVGTPLGDQLYDAGQYYKGLYPGYSSPIQLECQPNFVIMVSDGMHTKYSKDVRTEATLRFTEDHGSSFAGTQNVIVHTIGFDIAGDAVANDILQATAINGGGNFFAAKNAAELELSLQAAIRRVIAATFSFANPVIPTTSLSGSDKAYVSSFQTDPVRPFWRGFLKAYQRGSDGLVPVDSGGVPLDSALVWEAGQQLSLKSSATRLIFTSSKDVSGKPVYQEFVKTNNKITPALLGLVESGPVGAAKWDAIIDFIRGIDSFDEDLDGNVTEERAWKLGDIFHSTPVLVSPPLLPLTEQSYVDFKNANSGRTSVLIVGANDGMLHAFRESDGEELWAFIPPDLLDSLDDLTVRSGEHRFYVDSSPIAADIKVKVGASDVWKTIVIFGLRRGGKSYYALDITDTEYPKVLWTFTDPKMGNTWSEPAIGKVKIEGSGGKIEEKFVAFFGGGHYIAQNNDLGKAFFVVDLETGEKLWEYYNDGSTGDLNYMNFSLAANPTAADLNSDGFIDRVYIGDIGGQLWKFDVSGATSGLSTTPSYTYEFLDKDSVTLQRDFTKKIAAGALGFLDFKLASDVVGATPPQSCSADCYAYAPNGGATGSIAPRDLGYVGGLNSTVYGSDTKLENLTLISENGSTGSGGNWTGKRLFNVDTSQPNPPPLGEYFPAQAIYSAPAVAFDDRGDLWVYFGAGDRIHPLNASVNRFYGIKDDNPIGTLTESDLKEVTSTVASVDSSVQGWFFKLGSDEKVLAAADVFNSIVLFSTFTPTSIVACDSGGGTAKLYAVQMVTGFAAVDFTTGYALVSTNGSVTRARTIGTGIPSKPIVIIDSSGKPSVITGTSNQEISNTPLPPVSLKWLIGWREVF